MSGTAPGTARPDVRNRAGAPPRSPVRPAARAAVTVGRPFVTVR